MEPSSDQWGHRGLPTCPGRLARPSRVLSSSPRSLGVGGGGDAEVGLLYLELSDKFEKPPLFLQGASGQLYVALLGHRRAQLRGQLRGHSGPKPGSTPRFPLCFPKGAGFLGWSSSPAAHRGL